MKKIVVSLVAFLLCFVGAGCQPKGNVKPENVDMKSKVLFINGSPNKNGNTARLAAVLLSGHEYETLNLTDYRIDFYGHVGAEDQLDEVVAKMKSADVVVVGSPVYWHNICASVRTVMERFYGYLPSGAFEGRKLFFVYQGEAPTKMMIEDGEYTMERFAGMYGFDYQGIATDERQAAALWEKLK